MSTGETYNHPVGEPVPLTGGWSVFRDRLFADAGFGPQDCDFLQCYDDYPIMVAIQMEELGFCKKGDVGNFLDRHDLHWGGSFPLNTSGGQLSCGQSGGGGGMIGLVEAIQQIRGEAEGRQIPGARRGVVSGYGMVSYGHGLATSALFLEAAHA